MKKGPGLSAQGLLRYPYCIR